MVEYGSIWSTADVFCQRCHRQKKGISLRNKQMSTLDVSLDLCTGCIGEIAEAADGF